MSFDFEALARDAVEEFVREEEEDFDAYVRALDRLGLIVVAGDHLLSAVKNEDRLPGPEAIARLAEAVQNYEANRHAPD